MSASEDRLNAQLIFQPNKRKPTCPNCIFVSFRNSWGKEKSWMVLSMDQAWRLVGFIWGRKNILVVYCLFGFFLAALGSECNGSCEHFHRGLMENNFEPKILKYNIKCFYGSKLSYKRINYRSNRENWSIMAR